MPPRLRDIAKALRTFGIRLEKPRRGSHWRFVAPGGRFYTVPAHNAERTEIPDVYIRGVCAALGIDEARLRALL